MGQARNIVGAVLGSGVVAYVAGLYTQEAKDGIASAWKAFTGISPVSLAIGLGAGLVAGVWLGRRRMRAGMLFDAVYLQATARYRHMGGSLPDLLDVTLTLVGSEAARIGPDVGGLRGTLMLREWSHPIAEGAMRLGQLRAVLDMHVPASDLLHAFTLPLPEAQARKMAGQWRSSETPMVQVGDVYVMTDRGPVTKQGRPTIVEGNWGDACRRQFPTDYTKPG